MKIKYEGKYLRIVEKDNWEYVERRGMNAAVIIVPVIGAGEFFPKKLVLIKEYRVPLNCFNISLPAGLVGDLDHNESIEVAAERELLEETGYKAGRLRFLTKGVPSSGLANEMLHFYLADHLELVSAGGGDETEDIKPILVPISPKADVDLWLKEREAEGCLIDPKVFMALYWAEKNETV